MKPNNLGTKHHLKEGDLVVIKNTYLGKKGTQGTVSHITKTQVTLQDRSAVFHTRKFTNVRRVGRTEG